MRLLGPDSRRLTWTFRVGRRGLEPLTPCASCRKDVFREVHKCPPQAVDQGLLSKPVRGRSSEVVPVAYIVAYI
jgi:hypothetical protein